MKAHHRSLARRAGALAGLLIASSAHAAPPPSWYHPDLLLGGVWFGQGNPSFSMKDTLMPDFDQRREHLDGNGSMHCVPTSSTDLLYTVGRLGYPALKSANDPIFAPSIAALKPLWGGSNVDWLPFGVFGATLHIGLLADLEGTSATYGTPGDDQRSGELAYLVAHGVHDFFMFETNKNDDDFNVGWEAIFMKLGVQVSMDMGWYKGVNHDSKDGSHVVAMAGMKLQFHPSWAPDGKWHYSIVYADPARDEGTFANFPNKLKTQSTFNIQTAGLRWHSAIDQWCVGTEPATASKGWGCIRFFNHIAPLDYISGVINAAMGQPVAAKRVRPAFDSETGYGAPELTAFVLPEGTGTSSMSYDRVPLRAFATATGSDKLFALDLIYGGTSTVATVRGIRQVVTGGEDRALYALGSDGLVRLARQSHGGYASTGSVSLARATSAIGYDPIGDRIVTVDERSLHFYSPTLGHLFALDTPTGISGTGAIRMAIDGVTGDVLLGRKGGSSLVRVAGATDHGAQVTTFGLEGVTSFDAFTVDPNGNLVVSTGGVARWRAPSGRLLEGSVRLDGQPAGDVLALPQTQQQTDIDREPNVNVLPEDIYGEGLEPWVDEE